MFMFCCRRFEKRIYIPLPSIEVCGTLQSYLCACAHNIIIRMFLGSILAVQFVVIVGALYPGGGGAPWDIGFLTSDNGCT